MIVWKSSKNTVLSWYDYTNDDNASVQEQYQFLHEALVEALKLSECSIPSAEFHAAYNSWETPDLATGKTPLEARLKVQNIKY